MNRIGIPVKDCDISFVVQGPIIDEASRKRHCTRRLITSIRKNFPLSQIIVSTWDGEDIKGLDYDKVIFSREPESVDIFYSGTTHRYTINHQIVSTLNGVHEAEREYVVKVRSDLMFRNDNILKYLKVYSNISEQYKEWRIFTEKIIVLPTYNHRRGMCYPFSIADWIYIGRKEDIADLFDIPLLDMRTLKRRAGYEYPFLEDNIGAEQYYCVSCIRKHMPGFDFWGWECKEKIYLEESEKFIAQNFVLVDACRLGITSQKIGHAAYAAKPAFSSGLYTFHEWKRLYNRYGGGQLKNIYNPGEDLIYKVVFFARNRIKKNCGGMYEKIVNLIRGMRRQRI